MEKFIQILRENGYKITNQRLDVLHILQTYDDEHLSSEEVFERLIESGKDIGLATVYRTLQILEESGLVYKLNLDGKSYRYELADHLKGEGHQHHHLICENCHEILEVKGDFLDGLEESILRDYGFTVRDHDVKFFGLCKACRDKLKE